MYPKPCKQWDKIPTSTGDRRILPWTQYDYKIVHYIFFLCFCSHHLRVNFFWANPWDAVDFTKTQPEDLVVFSPWILGAQKPRCFFVIFKSWWSSGIQLKLFSAECPWKKIDDMFMFTKKSSKFFRKIGYPYGTCNPYCLTRLLPAWSLICAL